MTQEMQSRIETLIKAWHEAGRPQFEHRYELLDYDSPSYAKTCKERRKYVALDSGWSLAGLNFSGRLSVLVVLFAGLRTSFLLPQHQPAGCFKLFLVGWSAIRLSTNISQFEYRVVPAVFVDNLHLTNEISERLPQLPLLG